MTEPFPFISIRKRDAAAGLYKWHVAIERSETSREVVYGAKSSREAQLVAEGLQIGLAGRRLGARPPIARATR